MNASMTRSGLAGLSLSISPFPDAKPSADGKPASDGKGDDELSLDKRAERYSSLPPLYSFDRLAEESVVAGFCGRDVKNAVIEAAVRTAQQGGESLTLDGL
ncbi:MAG: hypothetical protein LBR38_06655, partial [Synergistaceae bacterium]|nr:hypothetical protein [Synergistaceae bacterium]